MLFTAYFLCILRFFKLKTEGQTIYHKTKNLTQKLPILAYPRLV